MTGYDESRDALDKGYTHDEDACAACGAFGDQPCDRACPMGGEGACASCGLPWARWIESMGESRCEACGPLTTMGARCARGDL